MRGIVTDSKGVLIVFVLPNHRDFLLGAMRGCMAQEESSDMSITFYLILS